MFIACLLWGGAAPYEADAAPACPVSHTALRNALISADGADSTGPNNLYWSAVVDRDGVGCAVDDSAASDDSQWLPRRQIAAAKSFTANGLTLYDKPI